MTIILCPTRGGPASQRNQDQAIAIARERGARLLFLYVSDVRFLDQLASPILVDVQEGLDEMGEFMLTMAQERAREAGVEALAEVRHGVFRHALRDVIEQHQVGTVVLGSPAEGTGFTTRRYVQDLIQWLLAETAIEIFVTRNGEVDVHRRA